MTCRTVPTRISKLGIPPASGEVDDLNRSLSIVVRWTLPTTCKPAYSSMKEVLDSRPFTLMDGQPRTGTRDMTSAIWEHNGLAVIRWAMIYTKALRGLHEALCVIQIGHLHLKLLACPLCFERKGLALDRDSPFAAAMLPGRI